MSLLMMFSFLFYCMFWRLTTLVTSVRVCVLYTKLQLTEGWQCRYLVFFVNLRYPKENFQYVTF